MTKGFTNFTMKTELLETVRAIAKKNDRTPQGQIAFWAKKEKKLPTVRKAHVGGNKDV